MAETQHSIDELKRQLDVARGKKESADRAFNEARDRLHAARVADSGWLNQIVRVGSAKMVVVDAEFLSGDKPWRLSGSVIKKDGTLGTLRRTIYLNGVNSVTKEGEYVAPEAGK